MPAGTGTGTPVAAPTTSVLTMLTNALAEIGWVAPGETVTANDANHALSKANRLLSSWNTRRLYCYVIGLNAYTLPSAKISYTIGPAGADITAARPVKILAANILMTAASPDTRVPLAVLNVDSYNEIQAPRVTTTLPTRLYYQPTYPSGTIWLWPYPSTVANSLELETMTQLTSFVSTADALSFPPGYEDAITYSLAEALCPTYGRPLTPELMELARRARANIQGLNSAPPLMTTDVPGEMGGDWNYLTGSVA